MLTNQQELQQMRSELKLKLTGKTADGWYPWFAWRPVKIYHPIVEPNDPQDRAWNWVWLEYVEWRHAGRYEEDPPGVFIYRMRQGDNR